nr:hypothetical protein [Tanacetum cinerariifolium]
TEDIRNTKAYKEYYACATREAAPNPKANARRKRGGSDSSTTPLTTVASPRPITIVAAAPRLTTAAKGKQLAKATSLHNPSEHGGSSTDKGTGSKLGVLDVPSDDSEEEISWNSSDEEDVDAQDKGRDDNEGEKNDKSDAGKDDDDDDQDDAERDDDDDDDDDEEEITKRDEQEDTESGEGYAEETKSDEESAKEETREKEEESFDPIPRTPEDSEDDGNGKKDQGLRVSEEQRLIEEEEADEHYHDVDINQGWGLQVSQDIEDSHVTLTPVKPDCQQESSSVSSFVTSMLNPISDAGVEPIFTTASSPIALLQTPTPIMTPSTISIITTSNDELIPPTTIPSETNQFAEAVSNIPGVVHQYMSQKMMKAIREAVQIQTDRLQDSFQRENDEFLRTIDENIKKIIKGSSHSSRTSYAVAADLTEMELKKILIEKMEGNKRVDDDDQEGPSDGSERGSKRRREGREPKSASTPSEPATKSASRSTSWTQSRHMSASESAFTEEPVQTTYQMDEPPHPEFETDRDWNKTLPAVQGSAQTWISELEMQADSHSTFNELLDTSIDFSNFIMNMLCFYGFAVNRESALDVYSKRRIIAVTDLKVVKWHNYKHLDWISVRRDDDKIYKFKEGNFKRLRLQDIEDMLLLLVQGKLSNLSVEERFSFNVSLRMFTRSIVIQRDETLNDVRNALDDRLKGIRMQYLPQTI